MGERVEIVVKNITGLGEGPHWDEKSQCLYFVDLLEGDVCKFDSITKETSRVHLGDKNATLIIPREEGGFVVTQHSDIAILESWNSSQLKRLTTLYEDSNMSLNDGKADASGRLWVGSYFSDPTSKDPATWPIERGSLYCMDTNNKVEKKLSRINMSNGMDWSTDNTIMYYIDSKPRRIYAFDFDNHSGNISNQRTVADFSGSEIKDLGYADGMTVDEEGKLWVACAKASKVVKLDDTTGQVIQTINLPVEFISSCCFGGKVYSELYVTSGRSPEPLTGSIFKITGLGVKGKKANVFHG